MLQAGTELLLEVGYEGFALQEVSRRSGVSIGSIFARAPSKEALILAIYDREMAKVSAANEGLRETPQLDDLKGRELMIALVELMARSRHKRPGPRVDDRARGAHGAQSP